MVLASFYHALSAALRWAVIVFLLLCSFAKMALARDADLPMQSFTQRDGVDSSYIFGLAQDHEGYLYLLTQRSLYFFSGQRFYQVKVQETPNQPNFADSVRFLPDGRVVVLQRGGLRISQRATSSRVSPLLLRFRRLKAPGLGRIENVFLDAGRLTVVDPHGVHLCETPEDNILSCQAPMAGSARALVYQIGDRVFYREPGGNQMRDLTGLRVFKLPWDAEISGSPSSHADRSFYAFERYALLVPNVDGTFARLPTDWVLDQGNLGERPSFVVETPDATVFFDGNRLRSFNGQYWTLPNHDLGREQDIHFAYADRNRQLWTVQDSVELVKLVGWGSWENLEPQSIRSVWSVLSGPERTLLLTDQGLYQLDRNELGERLREGNFFFGLSDGGSGYWMPVDDRDLLHCLFQSGHFACDRKMPVQRILGLALSSRDHTLWIASDDGMLAMPGDGTAQPSLVEDENGQPLSKPASAIALRDDGTPWAIIGNALYRRGANGRWQPVLTHWANGHDFSPLTMVFSSHDDLWVGGVRARTGLVHIHLDGNRIGSTHQIGVECTGSQIIFSLLWDRHRRLWVGTENGLAAYDGRQWIRVTRDDGLISANINQQGLTEDPDGSIWITTTRGVSHLLHPEHLFEPNGPQACLYRGTSW
ncbi:ligand-binding sensor domain-containing protein [Asaia bogorensis]|uniref:hypothetical protein n=1 Tax=Asaia bogorensis TaxID=91915 RepID=UPI002857DD33|nr:hypothetical protein [Asaia bogorensis]MDR6182629.1 hypothetical protein [Asaia bogorensis NBRC 16594]